MSDTPLRDALEQFLAQVERIAHDAPEEIVLGPRAYRALETELSGIGVSYCGWNKHTGFREIKFHGPGGITRIRPHIPELDDYR